MAVNRDIYQPSLFTYAALMSAFVESRIDASTYESIYQALYPHNRFMDPELFAILDPAFFDAEDFDYQFLDMTESITEDELRRRVQKTFAAVEEYAARKAQRNK
ncbi:MAG TPA: colicin immunity domain-containing protein [Galbitalea sp.]